MSIHVTCDQCGRQLEAKDEYAGRRTQCPDCGRDLIIPGGPPPEAYTSFDEVGDVGPEKPFGEEPTTSGKAITSFVLGLLSLACLLNLLTGIPAIIFGILGLNEVNRSGGRRRGQGLAISGIVTGAIGCVAFPCMIAVSLPVVNASREAARRSQCSNNLKQIGLAMHNFHDANGHLPPPAILDEDGNPLLSWRVAILPYIEQQALYNQFHLDEPWDSPHNLALASAMPITYICPSDTSSPAARGQTGYVAVVGPGTLFDKEEGVSFQEVTDGTSNTLMVAETRQLVPWTKPDDLAAPPPGGVPSFGSFHPGGFNVLLADGSVRFIALTINPAVLRALMTRSGGEVIGTGAL